MSENAFKWAPSAITRIELRFLAELRCWIELRFLAELRRWNELRRWAPLRWRTAGAACVVMAASCGACDSKQERTARAEFGRIDAALRRVQDAKLAQTPEALARLRAVECQVWCDFQRDCASAYDAFFVARRRVVDLRARLEAEPQSVEVEQWASAELLVSEKTLSGAMDSVQRCITRQGQIARHRR